ncbi:hypothetical protein L7F22_038773 [Adiantum nelumboides]|nr:hypothetical protein [Adiantum nelumboides]
MAAYTADVKKKAREEHQRDLRTMTAAIVIARDTEAEAKQVYDQILEKGDWPGAENVMSVLGIESQSFGEQIKKFKERFITGWGTMPLVGTPEQVVDGFRGMAKSGMEGVLMGFLDYSEEIDYFGEKGEVGCRRFCDEGATVLGTDIEEAAGQKLEESLRGDGLPFSFLAADVATAAGVAAIAEQARTTLGSRVDVLYNNHGIILGKPLLDTTEEEWDRVHDVDLKSVFLLTKAIVPLMPQGGSIINVSSAGGLVALPAMTAYGAAKGGLAMFSRGAAVDLAPLGIRVNAICRVRAPGRAGRPGRRGRRARALSRRRRVDVHDRSGHPHRRRLHHALTTPRAGLCRRAAQASSWCASAPDPHLRTTHDRPHHHPAGPPRGTGTGACPRSVRRDQRTPRPTGRLPGRLLHRRRRRRIRVRAARHRPRDRIGDGRAARGGRRGQRAAVIADADTGYGNEMHVARTVRAYEQAGAAAIQLEDQAFPKKCGHLSDKEVIDADRFVSALDAAQAARRSDLVIIARTDARGPEGIDAAITRARRYAAAGVDLIFVEAPETLGEIERVAAEVDAPLVFNVVPVDAHLPSPTPSCNGSASGWRSIPRPPCSRPPPPWPRPSPGSVVAPHPVRPAPASSSSWSGSVNGPSSPTVTADHERRSTWA